MRAVRTAVQPLCKALELPLDQRAGGGLAHSAQVLAQLVASYGGSGSSSVLGGADGSREPLSTAAGNSPAEAGVTVKERLTGQRVDLASTVMAPAAGSSRLWSCAAS